MSLNGGTVLKTPPNPDLNQIDLENLFQPCKINSGGYGIIDITWQDEKNVWAVGGSGVIFKSEDGGNTFKFNDNAKDIPGNLYRLLTHSYSLTLTHSLTLLFPRVKFFDSNKGYALGSEGVLLKYNA